MRSRHPNAWHDQAGGRGARTRLRDAPRQTSTSAIRNCSATTPSGPTSSACGRRSRCTTRRDSEFGPYWSVTKYNDIMAIDTNHAVFSSARSARRHHHPRRSRSNCAAPSFIAMDPPQHDPQRKTVAPMFTPTHLDELATNIRERSAEVLDDLPLDETFDWVDKVSIELTTQMLATLFDFPWEERRKLTRWSDVSTDDPRRRRRGRRPKRRSRPSCWSAPTISGAVERAGQAAAEGRPDLDDGARPSHARTWSIRRISSAT